jgi:hypothetical protein
VIILKLNEERLWQVINTRSLIDEMWKCRFHCIDRAFFFEKVAMHLPRDILIELRRSQTLKLPSGFGRRRVGLVLESSFKKNAPFRIVDSSIFINAEAKQWPFYLDGGNYIDVEFEYPCRIAEIIFISDAVLREVSRLNSGVLMNQMTSVLIVLRIKLVTNLLREMWTTTVPAIQKLFWAKMLMMLKETPFPVGFGDCTFCLWMTKMMLPKDPNET